MTDQSDSGTERNTIRTNVEVDEMVWRELRAQAIKDGLQVSEELEAVLIEYFDLDCRNGDET